jgi:hypothetical protein
VLLLEANRIAQLYLHNHGFYLKEPGVERR